MEAAAGNRRPLAVFAVIAGVELPGGRSDPGRRAIVPRIDAGVPAGEYGGPTMKTAGRVQRHGFEAVVVALALAAQVEVWVGPVLAPRGALAVIVVLWMLALLLRHCERLDCSVAAAAAAAAQWPALALAMWLLTEAARLQLAHYCRSERAAVPQQAPCCLQ